MGKGMLRPMSTAMYMSPLEILGFACGICEPIIDVIWEILGCLYGWWEVINGLVSAEVVWEDKLVWIFLCKLYHKFF